MSDNSASARPKLLLVNYACSPYFGSEQGLGWNRAVESARYCDTWAIVEADEFEADLKKYASDHGPIPGLHFVFVEKPRWQRLLGRVPGLYYLSYNLWHRLAQRKAVELHAELHFDLAHQHTLCSFREPGYAWQLGIPFIWGPIGGTQNFPTRFLRLAGFKGAIAEGLRSLANWIQLRTSLRVRRVVRKAAAVAASNTTAARDFAAVHQVKPALICDVGIRGQIGQPRTAKPGQPLKLLWSGVFEHRKALPVLLEALARLKKDVPFELRVLGRGGCERIWKRQAEQLGLTDRITWLGEIPHAKAIEQFAWADVFTFTSLRDTTGTVVLEALAAGLPIVAFDHQGVGDVVTDNCGIKIAVSSPPLAIDAWERALRRLATDLDLRSRLSRGATERAKEYLWTTNGQKMAALYSNALGRTLTDRNDSLGDEEPSSVRPSLEPSFRPASVLEVECASPS